MKTQQRNAFFRRFSLFLLLFLLLLPPAAFAAAKSKKNEARQSKIVFLPFAVTTQPPQEHLRSGLTNILATRLSSRTGLTAVHGAEKTEGLEKLLQEGNRQEAKKILTAMQGDYLLIGSLEQQENGYEILIHVFGSGKKPPASFTRRLAALDKALPALDDLSGEIADKVFSRKLPGEEIAGAEKQEGVTGFQTAHPDRAYRDSLSISEAETGKTAAEGQAFHALNTQSSGELDAAFLAMDAGDLDGDGQEELILLEQGRAVIYRLDGSFRQIAELPLPGHLGLHTVHLADLDSRKGLEIYISASSGGNPASLVLRWDGSFHVLDDYVPYYLRPDTDSAGQPVLLGQAADGSIFRLTVSPSGKAAQAEQVAVPEGFGLYDFLRADLDQDGRREFIGLTEDNKLLILDQGGKPLWKSEDVYGAGRDLLGTLTSRRQADIDSPSGERKRKYLHTRIIAQDMTGDGRPEIVVSRNRVMNVKFFNNLRYFDGSSIAALRWDGTKMNQLWETRQVSGYTVDLQMLKSAGPSGSNFRLFFVESDDSGNPLSFWSRGKSVIKMQELAAAPVSK
jgi:TolB-like protein